MSKMNKNPKTSDILPIVIKVGGSFFNELSQAGASNGAKVLLQTIAELQKQGKPVVLIHGGGEQVLKRLDALGIVSEKKDGLRVSPDAHMPIVTSVLAGELNKQLVATCASFGINAVGISLADGNIAQCIEHAADIGAVGVPTAQSADLLNAIMSVNMVPIVASIGKDNDGRLYNVNADHAAICIAELLQTKLYFFADVQGVLDANKQLIAVLNHTLSESLIADKVITDGMLVKVKAAQDAANEINNSVIIASWSNAREILLEHKPLGTQILPASADK